MAKPILNEKTIADYMKRNKCDREEAIDLIKYEANVKEMARKVEHSKQGKGAKRERKPNELKEAIVAEIAEFLREDAQGQAYEDVEITNVSRMVAFKVNDKRFELTLIEKRPPKSK